MIAAQPLENHQYRLARHYLNKLQAAETAYQHGHENAEYALAMFNQEWLQIKQWQAWAAAYAHASTGSEIAELCKAFSLAGIELFVTNVPPQERRQWAETGLIVARQLADAHAEMVQLYLLARSLRRQGPRDQALAACYQALALAEQANDWLYMGKIWNVMGSIFYFENEYEQSRHFYTQALTISRKIGQKHEIGLAANGLGSIAQMQGNYEQARLYMTEYLAIAELIGQPHHIAMALRNLSMTTMYTGDYEGATVIAQRGVQLCEVIDFDTCLVGLLIILGDLAQARDSLIEASDYYQRSLAISRQINYQVNVIFALNQLGRLSRRMGDLGTSFEYLEEGLLLAESIGERWYCATLCVEMAAGLRVRGESQAAGERLLEGLAMVFTIESKALFAIYLLEATLLWTVQGRVVQAATWAAVLEQNFAILPSESHTDYRELVDALAPAQTQPEVAAAYAQGTAIDLDGAVQALMRQLQAGVQA